MYTRMILSPRPRAASFVFFLLVGVSAVPPISCADENKTKAHPVLLVANKHDDTLCCPGMPVRIHFTDDGRLALVANWTKKGQLTIIDAKSHREIKRLDVGGYAIGVEITPDGTRAFVGCEHTDGLHVVDMKTLTVETVLRIGDGPDPMLIWFPPAS